MVMVLPHPGGEQIFLITLDYTLPPPLPPHNFANRCERLGLDFDVQTSSRFSLPDVCKAQLLLSRASKQWLVSQGTVRT